MAGGKFSEANLFGMTIRESANDGSDFTNPDADYRRLFLGEDGLLHLRDSAGTVTTPAQGALTDPMTTRGDVLVRNAANATARLATGSAGQYLGSDGTDTAFSAVTDAKLSTSDITTNNASTTKHGFAPKYPNDATKYLDGTGAYSVPAGSGGGTIVRPALTPVTPTDDFNAALSGWTAVSNAGSFDLTKVFAQADNGSRLWLPFASQHGYIYKTTTDVDQEWIVGGLICGPRISDVFFGIAITASSGDGVAVIYHTSDNTVALLPLTAGVYSGSGAQIMGTGIHALGAAIGTPIPVWMRLTRVGNTWDGYASLSGAAWEEHAAATISKTITASRKAIGLFGTATAVNEVITADWVHTV